MNPVTSQKRRPFALDGGARFSLGIILKILFLGMINALAFWAVSVLINDRQYVILAALVIAVVILDYIFISDRVLHLRFIYPGAFFMSLMIIFPIGFTIYISFTNYGTGHILPKQMVIEQYTDRLMLNEELPTYKSEIFKNAAGDFAFLLTAPDGRQLVAVNGRALPCEEAAVKPEDTDGDGVIDKLGDYERESILNIFSSLSVLQNLSFEYEDAILKMRSPEEFAFYTRQYRYDPNLDALIDLQTQTAYYAGNGSFTSQEGKSLDIGYQTTVGWRNFLKLAKDRRYSSPFVKVFTWTVTFAFITVVSTFVLGMFLAVLLNDANLKLRGLYRVLMIIPYAIPAFITCLIWRGMFQTEMGTINNAIMLPLLGRAIPWFQDPFWAKVAVLIVNLWLGFPYMMLICMGALQSIPGELYEAAMVDGANGWYRFRRITLPLLLSQLAPLLIASFAFNFNNFNTIYLVTKGRPAIPGAQTPTGATDILITYTYRMAFEEGGGGDYGLAAAVSLIIFLIISSITWFNFKSTRAFEEVPQYD